MSQFEDLIRFEPRASYQRKVEATLPCLCLLCGVVMADHDDAACVAKMAAWRPHGFGAFPDTAEGQRT